MRRPFYAIGLDDDQNKTVSGLRARRAGTKARMLDFIGQYPGPDKHYYSGADHLITLDTHENFVDDLGQPVAGGIYRVAEVWK